MSAQTLIRRTAGQQLEHSVDTALGNPLRAAGAVSLGVAAAAALTSYLSKSERVATTAWVAAAIVGTAAVISGAAATRDAAGLRRTAAGRPAAK